MTLRLSSLWAMLIHQGKGRVAAAAALTVALTSAGLSNALAAPDSAASAPDAASTSYAAGSQYTVKPGQSLNDVAIAVTQSHDKATLARASHALFDANPNAFMSHDPSRMRVGAMLTVPALDATGGLMASGVAASSAGAASGAAAAATAAASGAAQTGAAAGSGASAATPATVPGTASAPAETSAAASSASASASSPSVASSAPVATSQAIAASDAHAWSGSIQPSASAPAVSAPTPAPAAALPASQPKVSSLQQLLALKNRVLMELQKHGIGGSAAPGGVVATSGVAPAAGASTAALVVPGHGATAAAASNDGGFSQKSLSIAAAVGAALVVLLAALRMRRRQRDNVAAAQAAAADRDAAARENEPPPAVPVLEQVAEPHASDDGTDAAVISAAALAAAEREAAEGKAAQREAAEREAAEREAEARRAASQVAAEQAAAERAAAEHAAAERLAAEQAAADQARAQEAGHKATHESEHETATHRNPQADALSQEANLAESSNVWEQRATEPASIEPVSGSTPVDTPPLDLDFGPEPLPEHHHDNLDAATTAASLAAAAELGAEALPLTSLEPVDEIREQEEESTQRLQANDEPVSGAPAEQQELSAEPQNNQNVPPPVIDFPQQHAEPHAIVPPGQPFNEESETGDELLPPVPTMSIPPVPTEFPADAVDAFGSLDMPLPPRIESTADDIHAPASLTTQPVASLETTEQQALAPQRAAPQVADEITAGTAGPAAVAGLGAAGFGALKLDFDLELPPSPAQPWPAFTPTDLIRIARNKLDLATEYIELGDLSGARTLINEVIEANDPATRTEARALLSTLAPLS